MKTVLFVCTGNTCRSPMAEVLFTRYAEQKGKRLHILSAGTQTVDGLPASEQAVQAVLTEGLDLSTFRSHALTKEMLDSADVIVAIGNGNGALLEHYGYDPVVWDICDPYGQSLAVYEACMSQIASHFDALGERLW